jgi:DNA (cytosine-5)-methyltransferase 1
LVWENVHGVLSSNGGQDFGVFLGALGELGYGFAYRVLDAQYFGVAQRRRRVFVVGYLGDWRAAAAVLFERHSLQGHPAPSREKREDPPASIGTGAIYGGSDINTADTVTSKWAKGSGGPAGNECGLFVAQPIVVDRAAFNQGENAQYKFRAEYSETMDSLVARGPHAVLQPICLMDQGGSVMNIEHDMTGTLRRETHGHEPIVMQPIASSTQTAWSMNLMSPGRKVREDHGVGALTQQCHCPTQGNEAVVIQQAMAVRRLTPKECERLQGFPDNYTDIQAKGKPTPDGPRYKALGNSMAVPVMAWIGQRIEQVEAICKQNK